MQRRTSAWIPDMPNGRALFVTPEVPYPTRGGGALRSASLLEYLAKRYEVDVIVFREPGAEDPSRLFPPGTARRVHVLELPHHRNNPLSRAVRNAGRLARGVPPLVDRFAGFADRIASLVHGESYRVAAIEHFWCAPYWEQVAPVCSRTVLDLHNIESVLHERCARTETGPGALAHQMFCRAARDLEARWLPRYDCLLATSTADAELARALSPRSLITVYPNAIPFVPRPNVPEREMVIFSGNLEYHPNVSAVRFFRNEIWPILRDRWPSLVWRVAGKNSHGVRKHTNGDTRIELPGPMENAIAELAAARVVVVPLLAGSGTRFKVIEAWAAGRAVVATTIGVEGLPARHGENVLIADGARDFADAVSRLLASPSLRLTLGETGRTIFESEFTWDSGWQKLDL
jgi:glycosyltransferase involved in cell wall biosynthesis